MNRSHLLTRYFEKTLGVALVSLPKDGAISAPEEIINGRGMSPDRERKIALINFGPALTSLPPSVQEMASRLRDAVEKECKKTSHQEISVHWLEADGLSGLSGFDLTFAFGASESTLRAVMAPSLIEMAGSAQLKKVGWTSIQAGIQASLSKL